MDFLSQMVANPMLLVSTLLTLGVILVNGWTDAPNAIATCVTTRAIKPKNAIYMAAIFNFLGLLVMTMINFMPATVYAAEAIQNASTSQENVEFNATINNSYSVEADIDSELEMNLNLKVSNTGYVKDASISSVYAEPIKHVIKYGWWFNVDTDKWEEFTSETVVTENTDVHLKINKFSAKITMSFCLLIYLLSFHL